jgi:hypothetical protein
MKTMQFRHTADRIKDRSQTVTRRLSAKGIKVGDLLEAINQRTPGGSGSPARIEGSLTVVQVTDVRQEPLKTVTDDLDYGFEETSKEGYLEGHPRHWPSEFVEFICASNSGCTPDTIVTRIEFKYID